MALKMHRYEDGLTGLAAFCDTCGEQITKNGFVIWNSYDESDWLVIHQGRCEPQPHGTPNRRYGSSMPLEAEIIYLANSAGVDLDKARKEVSAFSMLG